MSLPKISSTATTAMVLVALLALVAAGCDAIGETTTTTLAPTVTTTAQDTTATTEAAAVEGFTYRVGLLADILRPNHWALFGPDGTIPQLIIFGPTKPALFRIMYPGIVVAPDAASGLWETAVQEGEVWTVTQPMRDDYTWSDGSLLTAHDIVFTYETVRDAGLGASWISSYPYTEASSPRLVGVEAVDQFIVKYTFDAKPGAAVWPHQIGVAPIMPRAPWEPLVAEALRSDDPVLALYDSDPIAAGDLSGGPVHYDSRVVGESIEMVSNEHYANEGFTHQFWEDGSYALNGEMLYGDGTGDPSVEYTEGPYLDNIVYSLHDDDAAAMLALVDGEIDYWLPVNLPPALRRQGLEADNLAVTVNPSSGFLYMAFNLRKSPGKFLGFRQAMAYFDKENLTNNVLQGAFTPLYVMVPEGNEAWYNEDAAAEIASRYVGLSPQERLNLAYAALEADGFTWQTPPERDEDGNIVTAGAGMIDPAGNPVPDLDILTPPVAFGPERHTAALWLEEWAEGLGIPAETTVAEGFSIFDHVWPGVGMEPTFDMALLRWGLGEPAWLTFHEGFFHTRNLAETNEGGNATGYSNPDFDALADGMFTETDKDIAFDQVWQMEQMIADDLPYVLLFAGPITEFYSKDLKYPFTNTLAGIQYINGMPALVQK